MFISFTGIACFGSKTSLFLADLSLGAQTTGIFIIPDTILTTLRISYRKYLILLLIVLTERRRDFLRERRRDFLRERRRDLRSLDLCLGDLRLGDFLRERRRDLRLDLRLEDFLRERRRDLRSLDLFLGDFLRELRDLRSLHLCLGDFLRELRDLRSLDLRLGDLRLRERRRDLRL